MLSADWELPLVFGLVSLVTTVTRRVALCLVLCLCNRDTAPSRRNTHDIIHH